MKKPMPETTPHLAVEVAAARMYIARVKHAGAAAWEVSPDMRNRLRPTKAEEAGLMWLKGVEFAAEVEEHLAKYLERRDQA